MKKVSLALFILFSVSFVVQSAFAESPTDRGSYILSGSAGYSHDEYDEGDTVNSYHLSPRVLYFITNNVAVGGSLRYSRSESDSVDSTSYGIEPSARVYWGGTQVNPFLSLTYEYMFTKHDYDNFDDDEITYNAFEIGAGVDLFIAKNVAIEPFAAYRFADYDSDRWDDNSHSLFLGIGITAFIF